MAITVDVADEGTVQVRTADVGAFVKHFGPRISARGLLLETQEPLPRGRELELRMGLDEGLDLIEAVGMVAWKRRPAGDQPAAVGLHLLVVTSGAEFIQRLVNERRQGGRPVFDLDEAAPVSEDGAPIEADQIDRMIASRGERSGAADLEVEGAADPAPSDEPEDAPDFAPGFGKSETWNQELRAGMPQSVSSWLGGQGQKGDGPQVEGQEREESPPVASSPPKIEASTAAGPDRDTSKIEPTADEAGRAPWKRGSSEVKPPAELAPDSGPLERGAVAGAKAAEEAQKRSGPIKMKLAADRQPAGSASQSLSGALESSFVEASRRAQDLLGDDRPKLPETSEGGTDGPEALSTVVLKPDEMKKMVDRVRVRAAAEGDSTSDSPSESAGAAAASAAPDGEVKRPVAGSESAPVPSAESESEAEHSLLNIDRSVLESATGESFDYPQEDRTPMIIVGGIVVLIVVALVLWQLLT